MKIKSTFQKESDFTKELRQQVKEYLTLDPQGKFADALVWSKALLLIVIALALYLTIVFSPVSFAARLALVLLFSSATLFLGLNVMHESAHGNYSKHPFVNKTLALIFDLYGISSDLYVIKHTQFHHNYTNIYGHDGDISETPLIRMSAQQSWLLLHRLQVLYTPLLYALITITWPLSDLTRLVTAKIGSDTFRRPSPITIAKILAMKVVFIYLTYVLPIQKLGVAQAMTSILLFHFGLGVILALIFQVAHVHNEAQYEGSTLQTDWFVHQLQTSADFSTNSKLTNFLFGGLNFQVMHHLFPNVSYRHYPAIQGILKQLCAKHGYRYVEFPSFTAAVIAHFKWLQTLSRKDESCTPS